MCRIILAGNWYPNTRTKQCNKSWILRDVNPPEFSLIPRYRYTEIKSNLVRMVPRCADTVFLSSS